VSPPSASRPRSSVRRFRSFLISFSFLINFN
jgi:hypothetical protein